MMFPHLQCLVRHFQWVPYILHGIQVPGGRVGGGRREGGRMKEEGGGERGGNRELASY